MCLCVFVCGEARSSLKIKESGPYRRAETNLFVIVMRRERASGLRTLINVRNMRRSMKSVFGDFSCIYLQNTE